MPLESFSFEESSPVATAERPDSAQSSGFSWEESAPIKSKPSFPATKNERIASHKEAVAQAAQFYHDTGYGNDPVDRFATRMPFMGSILKAATWGNVTKAAERLNAGDATHEDIHTIAKYIGYGRRSEDEGVRGNVKELLAELPGTMAEFALTGGAYSAGKKGAEIAGKKLLGEAVERGVGKAAVAIGSRAVGVGAHALANPQRVLANTAAKTLPEFSIQTDDQGRTTSVDVGDTTSFLDALPKGLAATFTEMGSERAGGLIGRVIGKLPGASKAKAAMTAIAGRWAAATGKPAAEFQAALAKGGFNGVLGEMGEERVGEAGNILLGVDKPEDTVIGRLSQATMLAADGKHEEAAKIAAPAWRQLAAEGIAFAVPGAAGAVLNRATAAPVEQQAAAEAPPTVEPRKLQPMPVGKDSVAKWARENAQVAEPLITAAKAGKPISQKMMGDTGLYRGSADERAALAKTIAELKPEELVNLAAIDTSRQPPPYVGSKPTKATVYEPGDLVTLKPGEYGVIEDASDKRFLTVKTSAGVVQVDRREITSHLPRDQEPSPDVAASIGESPADRRKAWEDYRHGYRETPPEASQSYRPPTEEEAKLPRPSDAPTITRQMRRALQWMGYSRQDVRVMSPEKAHQILTGQQPPQTAQPIVSPQPREAQQNEPPAAPQPEAPVPPALPAATPAPAQAAPPRPAVDAAKSRAAAIEAFTPAYQSEVRQSIDKQFGEKIEFVAPEERHQDAINFLKARGVTARFYKSNAGINRPIGGFSMDGVVYLNSTATKGDEFWGVVGHEWSHASGADLRLADLPDDILAAARKEYAKNSNPTYRKYLNAHPDLWTREAAATYVQKLMSNADFRAALQDKNPALWRKIWNGVRAIVGDYRPLDANARRVLEELTIRQAEHENRAAHRKPLPPMFAALSDGDLVQALEDWGAIKKNPLGKRKKYTREQLEDMVNDTLFGVKAPPIIRFERPADDQSEPNVSNQGRSNPVASDNPAAQQSESVAPVPSDESKVVPAEAASNATVEPQAAEPVTPPSEVTQTAKKVKRSAKPRGDSPLGAPQVDEKKYSLRLARKVGSKLNVDDIRLMFPGAVVKKHWYNKGEFFARLPNGAVVNLREVEEVPVDWNEAEKAVGVKITPAMRHLLQAAGSTEITLPSGAQTNPLAVILLARDIADKGTRLHEAWHVASDFGMLSTSERDALVDQFSSRDKPRAQQDEDIAGAREAWTGPVGLRRRVVQFLRDLVRRLGFGKLLKNNGDEVFRLMEQPEFWSRRPERMLEGTAYQLKPMTPEYRAKLANPGVSPEARAAIDAERLKQQRESRPDAETFAEADRRLQNPDAAFQRLVDAGNRGTFLDDADAVVANRLINEKFEQAETPEELKDFLAAFDAGERKRTEAGRMFRQLRDPVETPDQRRARILVDAVATPSQDIQKKIDRELTNAREENRLPKLDGLYEEREKQTRKLLDDLKQIGVEPRLFRKLAKNERVALQTIREITTRRADISDKVREYWYNAILSGVPTQVRNMVGTTANAGWYFTGKKLLEVAVNAVARKKSGAQLGEFAHAYAGMIGSISRAGQNFLRSWRDEFDAFDADFAATTGRSPYYYDPAIKGTKGRVIRATTRAMRAVDVFNKTVIAHGIAAERAYRMAHGEGLAGEKLTERMNTLLMDPESLPWREAVGKAKELTFQQEGGEVNRMFKRALGSIRDTKYGYFVVPFAPTMVNLFGTGINMTPLGIATTIRKIQKGQTAHITEDIAQNIAAVAAFTLMLMAQDEDDPWITGKDGVGGTGKNRYSLWLGQRDAEGNKIYWHYGFIEPFATALGLMVDLNRAFKLNAGDIVKIPGHALKAFIDQVKNKTFAGMLGDIAEAVNDPERAGGILTEAAANFIVSWIPNATRSAAREWDDDVQNRRMRSGDTPLETAKRVGKRVLQNSELGLQDVIDGLEDLPRFDIWGDPIKRDTGPLPKTDFFWRLLSPATASKYEPFVGNQMIARWKNENPDKIKELLYPGRPEYTYDGRRRTMTDAEEAQFHRLSGQIAKRLVSLGGYDPSRLVDDDPTGYSQRQWDSFKDDVEEARKVAKEMLVSQWHGGKPADLSSDKVAAAIARKKKSKAAETLRGFRDNPDRNFRRQGESLVQYRNRRAENEGSRARASETLKRMSK